MQQVKKWASLRGLGQGFTIVELSVVIIVLAILVSIVVLSSSDFQMSARDGQRTADTEVIARDLELYYRTQASSIGPTYPPTTVGPAGFNSIVSEVDALIAPDQSTNSLVIASTQAGQTPTTSQYVYQPLNIDNTLCTASPCVKFKLYYRLERGNTLVARDSMRQQ